MKFKKKDIGNDAFWRHFEHLERRDRQGDPQAAPEAADMMAELAIHYMEFAEHIRSVSNAASYERWPIAPTWQGKKVY